MPPSDLPSTKSRGQEASIKILSLPFHPQAQSLVIITYFETIPFISASLITELRNLRSALNPY